MVTGDTGQPCFWVWDTSGVFSKLGCTNDSLQYYTTSAGRVNYLWNLNLERSSTYGPSAASTEIVAHYLQDSATVGSYTSIRDSGLEQVQYGMLAGDQTTFTAAGTVDFLYHAPAASSGSNGLSQSWATAYGTNYNCSATPPATTTLRCDDPLANGSQAAPATMSTLTLDKIETFVGTDTAANHLDYSYALAYNQDTPFAVCTDPSTGVALYCAGEHTLASVTPSAYLAGTGHAQQPTVFTYTAALTNTYSDPAQKNSSGAVFTVQNAWAYLASYDNEQTGVGESISYARAYNNTNGTPELANDNRYDPLFCTTYTTCTGSYAYPDSHAWSVQVVTQIQNRGKDSGLSTVSLATTKYSYSLAYTGTGCSAATLGSLTDRDCVGDDWIPSSDVNWLNYYDSEFSGFAAVDTISSAGDLTVDHYASTEGWGSPTTDAENYLTGTLKDEEIYSGSGTSKVLLQQIKNTYAGDDNGGSDGSCDAAVTGEYSNTVQLRRTSDSHANDDSNNLVKVQIEFERRNLPMLRFLVRIAGSCAFDNTSLDTHALCGQALLSDFAQQAAHHARAPQRKNQPQRNQVFVQDAQGGREREAGGSQCLSRGGPQHQRAD
jgi:hypothetical protein